MPAATILRNRLVNKARLRHWLVFTSVADLQSVKRAAEAIGITQPTATQILQDLETLLEITLFLRHAHGMQLTVEGACLLPMARRLLSLVDETALHASALAEGSRTVVRIAVNSAATGGPFARVLPVFARQHPDILVQLQEANVQRQAELIANGDIDAAICREPPVVPAGWFYRPLWNDRFAIVADSSHPLCRRASIRPEDLRDATWLALPTTVSAREAFDRHVEDRIGPLRKFNVLTASVSMITALMRQESLLALLPHAMVEQLLDIGQLAEVPWPENLRLGPMGVLAPAQMTSPALQTFVSHLASTATCGEIVGKH